MLNLQEIASKLKQQLQSYQDDAPEGRGNVVAGSSVNNDIDHAATRNTTECCAEDILNLQQRVEILECDVIALRCIHRRDGRKNVDQNWIFHGKKTAKKMLENPDQHRTMYDVSRNIMSIEHDSKAGCLRALFLLEQFENYNRERSNWSDSMWGLFACWQSRHYRAYKHVRETSMMIMPAPAKFTRAVLQEKKTCIEWLMEQELLPRSKNCPKCKEEMKLNLNCHGMGRFRCQRMHGSGGQYEQQLTRNTFFEHAKISPMTAVLLIYAFTNKMSFEQAIRETSRQEEQTSPETVSKWYSYCREICMDALDRKYDECKIGGEGHIVEITECKIGRRKYNKGRMIDGHWILGMIDNEGGFRLEICPDNKCDRATLEELIKKHVIPGTTIVTDCWRGYNDLDQHGFILFTVNNKYRLVDPETCANTHMVSNWKPLRKRLARGVKDEQLAMHLCELLWRKEIVEQKMDPFIGILHEIKMQYPVQ